MVKELDTRTDWQGKRVAAEGYVFLQGDSADEENGTLKLALFTKPMGAGERLLDFQVASGGGSNQVSLPTVGKGKSAGYKTTSYQVDLAQSKVTLADGSTRELKSKVLLSGTVKYVPLMDGGFSHMRRPAPQRRAALPLYSGVDSFRPGGALGRPAVWAERKKSRPGAGFNPRWCFGAMSYFARLVMSRRLGRARSDGERPRSGPKNVMGRCCVDASVVGLSAAGGFGLGGCSL